MTEPITAVATAVIKQVAPGLIGALISLRYIKIDGTFNKITSVLGGAACTYYFSETVAAYLGARVDLIGFVLGLFGLSIIAKCFEVIAEIKSQGIADWIMSFLPKKKGE